jgi:hypothetical protein
MLDTGVDGVPSDFPVLNKTDIELPSGLSVSAYDTAMPSLSIRSFPSLVRFHDRAFFRSGDHPMGG